MYSEELKTEKSEILSSACECEKNPQADITKVIDEVLAINGSEPEKVILILQEVQKRLNWLPSEALKYICKVTDITPEQISGVSTFYSFSTPDRRICPLPGSRRAVGHCLDQMAAQDEKRRIDNR